MLAQHSKIASSSEQFYVIDRQHTSNFQQVEQNNIWDKKCPQSNENIKSFLREEGLLEIKENWHKNRLLQFDWICLFPLTTPCSNFTI